MKLARSNSSFSWEVGVDREVSLTVSDELDNAVLTRYYTEEEMQQKYEDARGEGKKTCFIPPYVSQGMDKQVVKMLYNQRDNILSTLLKVQTGMPVSEKDTFIKLGDAKSNLYLNIDTESTCVHLRTYWFSRKDGCLKPHRRGVTVTCDEFTNTMVNIEEVYKKMFGIDN